MFSGRDRGGRSPARGRRAAPERRPGAAASGPASAMGSAASVQLQLRSSASDQPLTLRLRRSLAECSWVSIAVGPVLVRAGAC